MYFVDLCIMATLYARHRMADTNNNINVNRILAEQLATPNLV